MADRRAEERRHGHCATANATQAYIRNRLTRLAAEQIVGLRQHPAVGLPRRKGTEYVAAADMRGRGWIRNGSQYESSQVIMVARSATGLARRERERRDSNPRPPA